MPSSSVGGFVPFSDHHSIVSCAVSLAFNAQSVFVPEFQKSVRQATKSLELPNASPSYGVSITMDPLRIFLGVNRSIDNGPPPVGVEFIRSDEDGRLTWRHQALPNSIMVQTNDYVRWKPFKSDVQRFIEAIRGLYALESLISVKLEYVDRFACNWTDSPPDAWEVLKRDSQYINLAVQDGSNLWHSHVGERFPIDGGVSRQRDVRIETIDELHSEGVARNVTVLTAVQDFLPSGFAYGRDVMSSVMETLDSQHDGLKAMLSEILNDNASNRISLNEP